MKGMSSTRHRSQAATLQMKTAVDSKLLHIADKFYGNHFPCKYRFISIYGNKKAPNIAQSL
jgi:hypothetical protein